MNENKKVVIIGAGNMATQLCKNYFDKGAPVYQVYSRNHERSKALEKWCQHAAAKSYSTVDGHADFYLLCVPDNAITGVAKDVQRMIKNPKAIVAHTSGSTPSTLLQDVFSEYCGVFYPLQSLRKERLLSLQKTTLLISANSTKALNELMALARLISDEVYKCSDDMRSRIHVPAVIVNNFVNYLYHVAYDYCDQENIPFHYLYDLIRETAERISTGQMPADMQTGPAVRQDTLTLGRHNEQLKAYPDYKKLYHYLTKKIMENHKLTQTS